MQQEAPDYLHWNDLLAKHFFSEEKAGKEVLLYVNEQLVEELGQPYGAGLLEFVEAIKAGPPWTTRTGICQKALQTLDGWRQRDLKYPPYIAYLALFVIAAGREGDFAPHAYYPRLRDLLGEPGETRAPSSFDGMINLWDDLERWSREDEHENLGRFVARIRGGWWKVGLPLSQTLISEDERKHLPLLLSERGLDPSDLPSPEVILPVLLDAGAGVLQRRTLRLLESDDEGDIVIRNALADLVIEELEAWDGTVTYHDGKDARTRQTRTSLRLCMKHDRLAQQVTCHVRIKTAAPFPEDGCTFVRDAAPGSWTCTERFSGWSNILRDADTDPPNPLNGAMLDWTRGERLSDKDNSWTANLRAASTRVFTQGKREGLPDWIEKQRLERNTAFLIVAIGSDVRRIRDWGIEQCSNFEEYSVSGLPAGWTLFFGEDARQSCLGVAVLTISPSIRLLLRGGVKTGPGNTYLKAVPPCIIIENGLGTESVTIDGQELRRDEDGNTRRIPDNAPTEKALRIEAHTHEQIHRKVIRLEEARLPLRDEYSSFRRDPAGRASSSIPPWARGAVVQYPQGESPAPYPQHLPLHLSARLILIGESPGQIAIWPAKDLPQWHPVWAIVKTGRKKAQAVFCGNEEQALRSYIAPRPLKIRALVRQWSQALWYRRKRVDPPQLGALRDRWREYMEVARHVR